MNTLLVIAVLCLILYLAVTWFIPLLLAWYFKRKFHIKLQIGRIGWKFLLRDVTVSKNGYSIHIGEVSFRSSFFNSEINKLLSIILRDVKINNNVEEKGIPVVGTLLKPLLSKQNSMNKLSGTLINNDAINKNLNQKLSKLAEHRVLDFRETKLPPGIITFAQFMEIHIYNLSTMLLRGESLDSEKETGGCWLLANISALHVDCTAAGASRALILSASIVDASAKLLPREKLSCFGELSCGITLEASVKAYGPLSIEKVHCTVSNPTTTINESLYGFIADRKQSKNSPEEPTTKHIYQSRFSDDFFARISPIIPKNFSLKIDMTTVTGVKATNTTEFLASLQNLQINTRFCAPSYNTVPTKLESVVDPKLKLPQVYVAFQIEQLQVHSHKEKLLFLNKLKLDAKLEKSVLNLYLIMNVISLTYNHEDVYAWYYTHIQSKKVTVMQVTTAPKKKVLPPWLESLFSACVVQGCAELWGVSLHARTNQTSGISMGCGGLKIKLDQLADSRGSTYTSNLGRLLLGSRHWSTELLVDSGWLTAGPGASAALDPPQKKQHVWGTTLYLGVALIKWGSHGPNDSKIEAMLDCLRVEWNTSVAKAVSCVIDCVQEYVGDQPCSTPVQKMHTHSSASGGGILTVNVALTNVNIFTIMDKSTCLMMRLDAVSTDKSENKVTFVVSGLKMVELTPYRSGCICQRSDEISSSFFHIKLARIEHMPANGRTPSFLDVQILEYMNLEWSANLHLKFLAIFKDMDGFKVDLKQRIFRESVEAVPREVKSSTVNGSSWCLSFKGDISIAFTLSVQNRLRLNSDDLTITKDLITGISVAWNRVRAILNGDDILTVDGLTMERVPDDPLIREERAANENFKLEWNNVWGVNIGSMMLAFPYEHRFAEAIQGEFVSHFKWLKAIHQYKKKPFTADSPLPSDLQIKIEEFVLEMSDDPFEVKLRDNYELLEDEYKESLKRKSMLDAKVAELCKPHLFLPIGKVEQLYTALRHKDAQIYVQRSRAAPPPRTRLVACVFTNVELLAMADPSVHGTQNCIRVMKDIDFDSPWPEDGLEFSTLWCRAVVAKFSEWQLLLRDFPQPLLSMKGLKLWGDIVGAEQTAPPRALRTVTIEQGQPWGAYEVERSMMTLKFYHDLNCEMEYYSYSFGPCWEPVIAQCNISFEQVSRPSLDPSLPLAWWDKMRLLFHGRLTVLVSRFSCLLHASLDPYNTTEEMELTWSDVVLDWTNGKVVFRGELNVFVRTASKYDDCRLLHLPGLKLAMKFGWICVADPRDHHSVSPCAPDKLPEYSSNQEHDSFRAFRSQGLNLHLTLDTKPSSNNYPEGPQLLVYGSTLRWFESLKLILSGVTRPTRRGAVFSNIKPRRPQLSRHYRLVRLSLALHSFQVYYWSSSSMQRGIELVGGRVTCGCEHSLSLVPCNDVAPLKRRPRANWTAVYMNCELSDAVMWLKCALQEHETSSEGAESGARSLRDSRSTSLNVPVEKCYCLSVGLVSYGREASGVPCGPGGPGGVATPTHRLTVHDLRGAWTKTNRDVAFVLFDTYMKTKQLKKNLSTKALKEEDKVDSSPKLQREDVVSPPPACGLQGVSPGGPPHAAQAMLAQLVAEAEREPPIVFSDDMSGGEASSAAAAGGAEARAGPALHGPKYCVDDENAHNNWLIALVNSQVLLKGYETRGYVILSAARAEVRQRVHRAPAAATSWCGELTCMQYYATVSAGEADELEENIQWVSVDEIEERSSTAPEISTFPDVPNLVGSGHSAGGVIGSTVGPSADRTLTQLQRIVSRCACEFYYLSYEDEGGAAAGVAGAAGSSVCWDQPPPEPCDAFTLMHHDLDVCTNSLQYAMLLDVVNNLVLYVEPERRRTLERRVRMRFKMQLQDVKDPRKPIQLLQNQVRGLVAKLRRLEKECYLVRRAREGGEHDSQNSIDQEKNLQAQVNECKEQVWTLGEELDAMVRVWREKKAPTAARADVMAGAHAPPLRLNEICFKSARWRLTDADGQLGIADLVLTNFLYTKTSRTDDSVEHQLELGYMRVLNLLPREPFPEVLMPATPSAGAPLARRAALRVFCRDRPPVGGISVKEHFEVNLVPITIGLTKKFFNTMLKFCFPERDPEAIDGLEADDDDTASLKSGVSAAPSNASKKSSKKKSKDSSFYVKMDDVEKMKERAEKNKLFIYIKIPEVPVRVSYKGSKEKNLEDFRDMPLVVPTLEYHNVTWTWLDLLLAMKSDTRRVIVSQAIRQRLQISRRAAATPAPQEEDKARLLLGDIMVADTKPQKKNVFKFSK